MKISRLINADKFKLACGCNDTNTLYAISKIIDNQPTAYDVDKVVSKLYEIGNDAFNNVEINRDYYNGVFDGISQAIEIIKQENKLNQP